MTSIERQIWRDAFDLFDWNRQMPNTEQHWKDFLSAANDFANRFDWKHCPLAHRLMQAVIDAVQDEVSLRLIQEQTKPVQMSLFEQEG